MTTITIKNIPRSLHLELKRRAELNRRSINNEIITSLERYFCLSRPDPEEVIRRAKELQEGINGFLTQDLLDQFKNEGRK